MQWPIGATKISIPTICRPFRSTLAWVFFKTDSDLTEKTIQEAVKAIDGKLSDHPDTAAYTAFILHDRKQDLQAKAILEEILKNDRPFAMRKRARELYEEVKNAKPPEAAPAAKTP